MVNINPVSEDAVMAALSKVQEPELHDDLVSLNMIRDLQIEDGQVGFTVMLTTPACPLRDQIELDSMDFLDIVMELRKRYGLQVHEEEYGELASLDSCANYLGPKLDNLCELGIEVIIKAGRHGDTNTGKRKDGHVCRAFGAHRIKQDEVLNGPGKWPWGVTGPRQRNHAGTRIAAVCWAKTDTTAEGGRDPT